MMEQAANFTAGSGRLSGADRIGIGGDPITKLNAMTYETLCECNGIAARIQGVLAPVPERNTQKEAPNSGLVSLAHTNFHKACEMRDRLNELAMVIGA